MTKFGLQSIKILALVFVGVTYSIAITIVVNAIIGRRPWDKIAPYIGYDFLRGYNFSIGAGIMILLVGTFGVVSILLNGYGMLVVYFFLQILLTMILLVGTMALLITPWYTNVEEIRKRVTLMTPDQLDPIQRLFKCCGIEKYTDYFQIWKLWKRAHKFNTTIIAVGELHQNETSLPLTTTIAERNGFRKETVSKWVPVFGFQPTTPTKWFNAIVGQGFGANGTKEIKLGAGRLARDVKDLSITPLTLFDEDSANKSMFVTWKEIGRKSPPLQVWSRPLSQQKDPEEHLSPYHHEEKKTRHSMSNFKKIANSIGHMLQVLWEPIKLISERLWGELGEQYESWTPTIIQDWIAAGVWLMQTWADRFLQPAKKEIRWWFGSGWDRTLFSFLTPEGDSMLPFSCCHNTQASCTGNFDDTHMEGCAYAVGIRWEIDNRIMIAAVCAFLTCNPINIAVIFILIGGIKDKYYF